MPTTLLEPFVLDPGTSSERIRKVYAQVEEVVGAWPTTHTWGLPHGLIAPPRETFSGGGTLATARASHPALAAVEDLRGWLGASYEDIALIAGFKASLIYYWRQRASAGHPVRPRPTTVGRLYEAHALVRAVAVALDGPGGRHGAQRWASSAGEDGCTPLELLIEGKLEAVASRSRAIVADQTPAPNPAERVIDLSFDNDPSPSDDHRRSSRFGPDSFE